MRAAFWCAWWVTLLCLPADLAQAQSGPIPQFLTFDQLSNYDGVTFCTDQKVSSFVRATLSPQDDSIVRTHEAKHREQRARFASCTAFQQWYVSPGGTLDAEAEAFMAGWCVAVALGEDGPTVFQDFADRIERKLGGEVNRLQVIGALLKYERCR